RSTVPPQALEILAAIETDLERNRSQYAARAEGVLEALDNIQRRIVEARQSASTELEPAFALLEASMLTLRGRLVTRKDPGSSQQAFQSAVDLFETHRSSISQQKSSARYWTDWGIALRRVGRNEESIALLSKVCQGGAAPPEAFGYLGY